MSMLYFDVLDLDCEMADNRLNDQANSKKQELLTSDLMKELKLCIINDKYIEEKICVENASGSMIRIRKC